MILLVAGGDGMMRVGYVTTYDPNDRRNWSGLGHAIMQTLIDQKIAVEALGPLETKYQMVGRFKGAFYRRLLRRNYAYEREGMAGRGYARQVDAKLARTGYDIIFSPGSIPVSRLQCRQPIIIWADATWACYISHYGLAHTLCGETIRSGHATELLAYRRSSLLIFASEWAAKSAITDYGVDPSKVIVVPFGANFLNPPCRKAVHESISRRPSDRCQLITIGVDWNRKNVPRSIELAGALNERGIPTTLSVVGCRPPAGVSIPEFVNVEGFIDKRSADGERKISALLFSSHFHILFSTAEAFGVVFAEANAHGVPNIASDVGGIGTAVINGRGGQRFNPDASVSEVADYVAAHVKDKAAYLDLASRARREFEERLNWKVSGALVRRHLEELVFWRRPL